MATERTKRSRYAPRDTDYTLEAALGNIPGARQYSISGYRDSVSNTVFQDITPAALPADGILPNPGGAGIRITSSSADDAVAGIGVQRVAIDYLTNEGAEAREEIDLNGLTPVNSINIDYGKIQWVHAVTTGTNGAAVGDITIDDLGGTEVYEFIPKLYTRSLSARFHVPAGFVAVVAGWRASADTQRVAFDLLGTVRKLDFTEQAAYIGLDVMSLSAGATLPGGFAYPLRFPAGTSVKIAGKSAVAGGNGAAAFNMLLLPEGA